jgi:CelD/BcsL family acetyltransferase involved in cellulose biosynthesis
MRGFYARMIPKLAARGALRLLFARQGERDVGYILGGVLAGCYRGLQFSYDVELEPLGVGNAMQLEQLTALCAEGVTLYDLGSEVPYKSRWGEEHLVTQMVIVTRRRGSTER